MHPLAVLLSSLPLARIGQAALLKPGDVSQKPIIYDPPHARLASYTGADPDGHTIFPGRKERRGEGDEDEAGPRGCNLVRKGSGPLPDEDTPEAFRDFATLQNVSRKAPVPEGYELAAQGLDGSVENRLGYLGVEFLEEYDPVKCASFCSDLPRCGSFNICEQSIPSTWASVRKRLIGSNSSLRTRSSLRSQS